MGPLGASLGRLLGLLGPLGARLDGSWRRFGLHRRPEAEKVDDGVRFGVDFGSFWDPTGSSEGPPESILAAVWHARDRTAKKYVF